MPKRTIKPKQKTWLFNVRIDATIDEAIDKLAAAVGDEIPPTLARSTAVRRAILQAAARLDDKAKRKAGA